MHFSFQLDKQLGEALKTEISTDNKQLLQTQQVSDCMVGIISVHVYIYLQITNTILIQYKTIQCNAMQCIVNC